MSRLLTSQRPFLELFVKARLKQRKALLQTLTDQQLKAVSEIAHNVLIGNVPLTIEQQKTVKKYKSLLYVIGDKRISRVEKRRVIARGANPILYVIKIALEHVPWPPNPS